MNKNQLIIGSSIYEKSENYNHDNYYVFAEDINGDLYKCHYGHDGDEDWYITCYENVDNNELSQSINVKYYYTQIGRIPFTVEQAKNLDIMVGKTLKKEKIDGKELYGFVDYDKNIFYALQKNIEFETDEDREENWIDNGGYKTQSEAVKNSFGIEDE